jgi:hypothetical protein
VIQRMTPHGLTRKKTLLERVPASVVTLTLPVVAPSGTVALIPVFEITMKVPEVPLNATLVVSHEVVSQDNNAGTCLA